MGKHTIVIGAVMKNETVRKPITNIACGENCKGILWRADLSRLEDVLGHEGFKCDTCGRRVKYAPKGGERT